MNANIDISNTILETERLILRPWNRAVQRGEIPGIYGIEL